MKAVLYDWAGGNLWLFHAINAQPPTWLDHAMWLASCVGDYRKFPLVLGAWLLAIWHWQRKGDANLCHLPRGISDEPVKTTFGTPPPSSKTPNPR